MPTINGATGFVTTQDYTYDDLNRLALVAEKQYGQTTPDWQQQFTYDRYGNRSMGTGSGQTFGRNTAETLGLIGPDPTVNPTNNRITPRSGEQYQFDASGNMTRDALGNRSVFDVENHQTQYYYPNNNTQVPDAKYFYDADGRRIKKLVGAETTIFVYDAAGRMAAEYTIGVAANSNPQTSYLTSDTLGSLRVATNAAGQIIARHDYLPFGDEIIGLGGRTSAQGFGMPDTTRQRFTGYEKDTESGLDFAQARYYGNGLGRFTGVDPSLESINATEPQSWNRYIYCYNNPLNVTDPTGLTGIWGYVQQGDIRRFEYFPDGVLKTGFTQYFGFTFKFSDGSIAWMIAETGKWGWLITPASATAPIQASDSQLAQLPSTPVAGEALPNPVPIAPPGPPAPPLRLVPPAAAAPSTVSQGARVLFTFGRAASVVGMILAMESTTQAPGPSDVRGPTPDDDNRRRENYYIHYSDKLIPPGQGLWTGSSATSVFWSGMNSAEASQRCGIPPPKWEYTVTIDPTITPVHDMGPTGASNRYYGGAHEYYFPMGTPPGSLSAPRPVPQTH